MLARGHSFGNYTLSYTVKLGSSPSDSSSDVGSWRFIEVPEGLTLWWWGTLLVFHLASKLSLVLVSKDLPRVHGAILCERYREAIICHNSTVFGPGVRTALHGNNSYRWAGRKQLDAAVQSLLSSK